MILLDTSGVEPADRMGAFDEAMLDASVPCEIAHELPEGGIHARMDVWRYGPTTLFTNTSSGYRLTRGRRHLRSEARRSSRCPRSRAGRGGSSSSTGSRWSRAAISCSST